MAIPVNTMAERTLTAWAARQNTKRPRDSAEYSRGLPGCSVSHVVVTVVVAPGHLKWRCTPLRKSQMSTRMQLLPVVHTFYVAANSVRHLDTHFVYQNLNGPFSAESTPIFTTKYAVDSAGRVRQLPHSSRDLRVQNLADFYELSF